MAIKLGKLSPRHKELARLLLRGETQKSAAAILGYQQARVSQIAGTAEFKELMAQLQEETDERAVEKRVAVDPVDALFKGESMNSALTLISLRDQDKNMRVSKEAAVEILNRAGYTGKAGKDEGVSIHVHMDEGKLALIAESVKEVGAR